MNRKLASITIIALTGAASVADAYELRHRIVRRIGTTDIVLPRSADDTCWVLEGVQPGEVVRLRVQFGVFDDANGHAPAGGFVGWSQGSIAAPCGTNTRTPGRLAGFNWVVACPGNGSPCLDPFTTLTGIDATIGVEQLLWQCAAGGFPAPMPQPIIFGLNSMVNVYEFTHVVPSATGPCCDITIAGNALAATGWGMVGPAVPPDCGRAGDPGDDLPGHVDYAPLLLPPIPFTDCVRICRPSFAAADFNMDGLVNSQDFFDFLTAFFASDERADFNDDRLINSQDFFDFLTCFFARC